MIFSSVPSVQYFKEQLPRITPAKNIPIQDFNHLKTRSVVIQAIFHLRTFINLLIEITVSNTDEGDSSRSWRAGVISPVPVITLDGDLTRGCMEFLMAPPGIPGTDFWNQPRVTGSPRASIIAAISERAHFYFRLCCSIQMLASALSRSSRICFSTPAPLSLSSSLSSFSCCTSFLPFSNNVSTVRIVHLIGGKWEANRAIVFHFVEAKESRVGGGLRNFISRLWLRR